MTNDVRALAAGVLAPGFNGTRVPPWLRRAVDEGLGSVVLFGHNIPGAAEAETFMRIAALTTELRGSRRDLLIAADEEGGDVTRIEVDHGSSLPGSAALGAVGDIGLTGDLAVAHGKLLRAVGIDCGLAPVADVNSNPRNPVIGVRSFGSDARVVADQVAAYTVGLQRAAVLACTKHFPGHGDTSVDSHHGVPYLDTTLEQLRQRELVPFAAAIGAGTAAVMPGHLVVPEIDELPASISPRWIEILRDDMGFDGLIVTDALDMAAVAATYGVPGAAVLALQAGADLLCLGNTRAIDDRRMYTDCLDAIVQAVQDGRISAASLVDSARRRSAAMASIKDAPTAEIAGASTGLRRIGRELARRAIESSWPADVSPIDRAPAVVDLRHGSNMAAGPTSRYLTTALRRTWPDLVELDRTGAAAALPEVLGPVLILVRSSAPAPDSVEARELGTLLRLRPGSIVIHSGWPTPTTHLRTVFSYGNAAVNAAVVCELLAGIHP